MNNKNDKNDKKDIWECNWARSTQQWQLRPYFWLGVVFCLTMLAFGFFMFFKNVGQGMGFFKGKKGSSGGGLGYPQLRSISQNL